MEKWEEDSIRTSSVPLPGGGDTHIHPFGPQESDVNITTRIPVEQGFSVEIHDQVIFPDFQNEFK